MSTNTEDNCTRLTRVLKFRSINKNTEDLFINKRLFFSYVEDFNDPFEFAMNFKRIRLQEKSSVTYHSFRHAFTVFCVCEEQTKDNILLWSHYADHHRGIAIEFTPDYHDNASPFNELKPVTYTENVLQPINETNDQIKAYLNTVIRSKAQCWSYEKEWRIVKLNNVGEPVYHTLPNGLEIDRGRLHSFKSSELTKVIIGCRSSKDDERVIMNWISKLENDDIVVEKCFVDITEYRLKFEQII